MTKDRSPPRNKVKPEVRNQIIKELKRVAKTDPSPRNRQEAQKRLDAILLTAPKDEKPRED